jgi:hypothetical protein
MSDPMNADPAHASPDNDDRVQDFLGRHGGQATVPPKEETFEAGLRGRSEVYAADGYTLRCDWSRLGSREVLAFSEIPPAG